MSCSLGLVPTSSTSKGIKVIYIVSGNRHCQHRQTMPIPHALLVASAKRAVWQADYLLNLSGLQS